MASYILPRDRFNSKANRNSKLAQEIISSQSPVGTSIILAILILGELETIKSFRTPPGS